MNRSLKRATSLAFVLVLALLVSWMDEILVHHDHNDLHPDSCCAVCRSTVNPGTAQDAGSLPTGIPQFDEGTALQVTIHVPNSPHAFSSPDSRAPPIA